MRDRGTAADALPTHRQLCFRGCPRPRGEARSWLNPEGADAAELKRRTFTNLYNQRPTWLDLAHRRLDEAVFAAYGRPAGLAAEEVLERLLALNGERAGAG